MQRSVIRLGAAIAFVLCSTMSWAAMLPIKPAFVLAVGQKADIFVVRGDCTGPVPSFSTVLPGLPKTGLGKYSDGGTSTRPSDRCKAPVKVRVISFTATKPGKQVLSAAGARLTMQVK